jgi:hypothetical protein
MEKVKTAQKILLVLTAILAAAKAILQIIVYANDLKAYA